MSRYYNSYSYIIEIRYNHTGYVSRYEFVSETEAQEFIDSMNNKLPESATIKWV